MTDFLLELLSEEIPARMQVKAKDDLVRLFTDALAKDGLAAESIEAFATPRRLALIAKGLPLETAAASEETKGPKVGAPPQAMEGFLRKVGLSQDQLVERDGIYFAIVEKQGRKTADVLAEAIPAIIRVFPWPKSQRWGAASISTESLRWVRPLQGIVALLGDDVVHCEIDGIVSGSATKGHRFHHSGDVMISNAADYVEKLREAHVIVHFSERCRIIRDGAQAAAKAAGLVLVEDEGLVAENAGLTEWPVPMLGRFDPAFLAVPEEVIQLTARVNQKYFVCKSSPERGGGAREARDGGGSQPATSLQASGPLHHPADGPPPRAGEDQLAPAFVCTANIVAKDGGALIAQGNEKVLASRLSDAKFFWEQDLKIPLDEQAKKLSQITFHEKLGTVADKVERVAKLARWLVEEGIIPLRHGEDAGPEPVEGPAGEAVVKTSGPTRSSPSGDKHPPRAGEVFDRAALADMAERAARLCKADLVTGMVGEFPELQGIMGGYYARAQGAADAVADAVRDHYKPVGQGDDVPTAPVTVAVSLADKLDTLVGFFAIGEMPTGSRDPFALRRAALAILALVLQNNLRLTFASLVRDFYASLYNVFEKTRRYDVSFSKVEIIDNPDPSKRPELVYHHEQGFIVIDVSDIVSLDRPTVSESGDVRELTPFLTVGPVGQILGEVVSFLADRLKVQQREAGVRHDLIDAVFALGGEDDLVRLLARVKALQAFVTTDEGGNLLAGYKRAANILKSSPERGGGAREASDGGGSQPATSLEAASPLHQPAAGPPPRSGEELALLSALDTAEPKAAAAIEAEDFEGAMAALASLRAPIDAFFEGVMVNDPDPAKRAFRLGLLTRFRDAVHRVADFSRIEG
jgi:glycyl-tRNA synthetase beta chain